MYKVGDKVVYPHSAVWHGREQGNERRATTKAQYLTIRILHNDMTVMVPSDNVDKAGLRKVIGEDGVEGAA